MDSITQMFSSLGGTGSGGMSGILPYLLLGTAGAGSVGNILANNKRNAVLNQQIDYTKALQKMTPAQVAQGIASLEQPLDSNLIKSVGNTVSGQLAERGLSQAPGIQAEAFAQGLAPYQIQEQQLAQDAFFKKLGLPISSRPSPFGPFPQTTNTTGIWQALASRFMNRGAPLPTSATNIPGFDDLLFGGGGLVSPPGGQLPTSLDPSILNIFSGGGLTPPPLAPATGGDSGLGY